MISSLLFFPCSRNPGTPNPSLSNTTISSFWLGTWTKNKCNNFGALYSEKAMYTTDYDTASVISICLHSWQGTKWARLKSSIQLLCHRLLRVIRCNECLREIFYDPSNTATKDLSFAFIYQAPIMLHWFSYHDPECLLSCYLTSRIIQSQTIVFRSTARHSTE